MTTWKILDQSSPDRLTVKYTADDGIRSVTMPDMFWDQETALPLWLGRVNPFPEPPPADKRAPPPMVGLEGRSEDMVRTPPVPQEELNKVKTKLPQSDPLTEHLIDPNMKPEF